MNVVFFFAPAITAALNSSLLAPRAGRSGPRVGAVDRPVPRMIHQRPIPPVTGRRRGARLTASHAVVTAIVAWGVLAFGAVYPWSYWPLLAGCAVAGVVVVVDRRARARIPRSMVAGLGVLAGAVLLQLAPLPVELLARVSPVTTNLLARYDLRYVAGSHGLIDAAGQAAWWLGLHPFSIDPARTRMLIGQTCDRQAIPSCLLTPSPSASAFVFRDCRNSIVGRLHGR